jgi:UDP-N-acetylmuramoyl-tripeptide--D-alanyl-D-alanine ligase
MEIPSLYKLFQQHPAICTDSRQVTKDSIFFGLTGEKFNGNHFAKQALDKGCSFAVIDDPHFCNDERHILVSNTLIALQELAHHHRKLLNIPVIAITGSNGKTTTKGLCHAILSKKYKTISTGGNLNNQIGVPLMILSIKPETEMAVIEMGANHKGEIAGLSTIAMPTYGLITNIGKAHLGGFGGFDGVISAKKELYEYIRDNHGRIFYNSDDDLLRNLSSGIDRIAYGSATKSFASGEMISSDPFLELTIQVKNPITGNDEKVHVHTHLAGHYNLDNILAAACVGSYFGLMPAEIQKAIEDYQPPDNRSQVIKTRRNSLIMDAYNANPTSMEQAIMNFYNLSARNKVLILGDMLELGEESLNEHLKILDLINKLKFKTVLLVGEQFFSLDNIHSSFAGTDDVRAYLRYHPINSSTILIKGSRGIGLERLVDLL